jgi:hypothetical protein
MKIIGKVKEMLAIRVAVAVLFGAFALCAQDLAFNPDLHLDLGQQGFRIEKEPHKIDLKLPSYSYPSRGNQEFLLAENFGSLFLLDPSQSTASRPKAVSFGKGYFTRSKIHKYFSYATLPLLAAEAVVGQKLLDEGDDGSLKSAHSGLAAGIGILFGVETVTGVWNYLDSRKLSTGNTKRLFHGILMIAADVGFIATAATAPHEHEGENERAGGEGSDVSTHRALAYTSIGIAAASYLYMLFTK